MLLDGRRLPNNEVLDTDVCIVGGGASGITLAREFIGTPVRVILIESGGTKFNHKTQWLYRGISSGRPYEDIEFTKQRYFGGASNKWFGRCRPLDSIDFEARSWVSHSGWPFAKTTLDPFYTRAHQVCQIDSNDYQPTSRQTDHQQELALKGTGFETKIFQFSPPTRFAAAYGAALKNAPNIKTFLHANAVSILLNRVGYKVDRIDCATLAGNHFQVSARHFILAASALEVTQLLLSSNDVRRNGIGNHHDLVGRYFMEHPHLFSAELSTPLAVSHFKYYNPIDYDVDNRELGTVGALGLTEEMMQQEKLLNASAFLVQRKHYKLDDRYYSQGGKTLTRIKNTLNHTNAPGPQFIGYLRDGLFHAATIGAIVGRRLKSIGHASNGLALRLQLESEPNPYSRVTLAPQKDRLGRHRINLHWQLTSFDLASMHRFQELLFKGLATAGYAVRPFAHDLDSTGWPVTMTGGKHHMGTTRMHVSPKQGVVDADCKVHSVENLFIAGSSVFPTCGQANPMLTIVALALRLADHVKSRLAKPDQ